MYVKHGTSRRNAFVSLYLLRRFDYCKERRFFVHNLSVFLEHAIAQYGIFAVFLAMLLESACIPLPSEVIMPFAGFEAWLGHISFVEAVIAGILGNLAGSLIAYFVGKWGGRPLLAKYGRYILFSERHFNAAQKWFDRYGSVTVLISRVLPAIRTFISLPAGIAKMNISKFIIFTTIGVIPWVYILTEVGYQLGKNWSVIDLHSHAYTYIFAIILIVVIVVFLIKNNRSSSK